MSKKTIFFQPYDEISEATITIKNLGRVNIEYSMVGINCENQIEYVIEPDTPIIVPIKVFFIFFN